MLALLCAAGSLYAASTLAWGGRTRPRPGTDVPLAVDVPGSEVAPALVPLALLGLAGIAGALALSGAWRRAVGPLLAAAGVYPVWAGLSAPGLTWGSGLAVLGGALLGVAGAVIFLRGQAMPRMGARYSAPASGRKTQPDLWQSLTDGDDPTDLPR